MNEIRLTFASEAFEAVARVLVEMGLSFRVEPVGTTARQERAAETAPAAKPQTPARTARKASKAKRAARPAKASPPADAAIPGAERLRAAIAKSGPAYRSPLEPPATSPAPPSPGGNDQPGEQSDA